MAIYILAVIYLTFRKDTAETFIDTTKNISVVQNHVEKGLVNSDEQNDRFDQVPYREDLADIPLPQ